MAATICLLTILVSASGYVWWRLVRRLQPYQTWFHNNPEPRAKWRTFTETAVVIAALFWVVSHLSPNLFTEPHVAPGDVGIDVVAINSGILISVTLVLQLLLTLDQRPWSDYGITLSNLNSQFRDGMRGFLACVLPMSLSMLVTLPLRGSDQQHTLLKLVTGSPGFLTVAVVGLTAVIVAPLFEELIFRVILQGWMTTLVPPSTGISIVAILFALVHGWRDGLALLPLAWILGYVFERRHSYLTVVVIHSLFNATMLLFHILNAQHVADSPTAGIPAVFSTSVRWLFLDRI